MRNKTLTELIDSLRAETRRSLNPAHNVQKRDAHIALLQRTQEFLWEDFGWPHLRVKRDVVLQNGQRYYSLPADLDLDRVDKVEFKNGNIWIDITAYAGIDGTQYTIYDSDLDERSWPIARWQIAEDNLGAVDQLEVWPVPSVDGNADTLDGVIRFWGIRKLSPLVAESDTADLDDRLIVLYAAAEELAASGAQDATMKLQLAKKLDGKLRGNLTKPRRFRMFGRANEMDGRDLLRGPPTVYYRKDS